MYIYIYINIYTHTLSYSHTSICTYAGKDKNSDSDTQGPKHPRAGMMAKANAVKELFEMADPCVVAKWPQFQVG
jgi:hypothetical protein